MPAIGYFGSLGYQITLEVYLIIVVKQKATFCWLIMLYLCGLIAWYCGVLALVSTYLRSKLKLCEVPEFLLLNYDILSSRENW